MKRQTLACLLSSPLLPFFTQKSWQWEVPFPPTHFIVTPFLWLGLFCWRLYHRLSQPSHMLHYVQGLLKRLHIVPLSRITDSGKKKVCYRSPWPSPIEEGDFCGIILWWWGIDWGDIGPDGTSSCQDGQTHACTKKYMTSSLEEEDLIGQSRNEFPFFMFALLLPRTKIKQELWLLSNKIVCAVRPFSPPLIISIIPIPQTGFSLCFF